MAYEFAGAYDAAVLDTNSQLLKLVSFELVTEPDGVPATLYTDRLRSVVVVQPFLSDAEGNVHIFTDPGRYRLRQVGFPPGEQLTVQADPDETEGELEAHVIAADPHPVYTTPAEAAAAAPVQSVFGRTGAVTAEQADYDTFFLTQAEGDGLYEPLLPTFTPGSVLFADGAGNIGEDNDNFFWDDAANLLKVHRALVGATAVFEFDGALQVRGAPNDRTVILRADATNPGYVLEIQNAGGGLLDAFDAFGRAGISTNPEGNTILNVGGSHPSAITDQLYGAQVRPVWPATADNITSLSAGAVFNDGASHDNLILFYANNPEYETATVNAVVGFRAANLGAGGVNAAYGIFVDEQFGAAENIGIRIDEATTQTLWLSSDAATPASGIGFGNARDAYLIRSAPGVVKTGGVFDAVTAYHVNGTKVVGAQGAAVADAVDPATAVTQLNLLLSRFRASTGHGAIAG